MKTLTIRQPWAELIAQGKKDIEVRTWKTNYRGKIAIHAGKVIDTDISRYENNGWQFLTGGIIAIADLVHVDKFYPRDNYRAFMQYEPGLFAWHLQNIQKVEYLPWRGMPGIFNIDDKLMKIIK
jgi:activating signal cointegrator 1